MPFVLFSVTGYKRNTRLAKKEIHLSVSIQSLFIDVNLIIIQLS